MAVMLVCAAPVKASESITAEITAPAEADEIPTNIDKAFEPEPRLPIVFPRLKRRLKELPPFVSEAELTLEPRSYYFDRENANGSENVAWALGGKLGLRSGKWRDLVSAGVSFYTSQRLYGPSDKDGTLLLQPDQEPINVLGEAFLRIGDEKGLRFSGYRQELNLPFINRNDSRMIPNTHEAYLLIREGPSLDFATGHVRQQKRRDSEEFVPLSQLAGAEGTHKGVSLLGARWKSPAGWSAGAIAQYGWDLFNTTYAEASWGRTFGDRWSAKLSAQYADQRSVGDELVGDFDTHFWGFRGNLGYRNAILTLALTGFADDALLIRPFGSNPSYNSMMLGDYDRPGERARRIGLSYNLGQLGLPAWSGFFSLVSGENAEDPDTGASLEDREEFNVTLDYRPESGPLRGLWLRLRYAYLDWEETGHATNVRLIINYELPAL